MTKTESGILMEALEHIHVGMVDLHKRVDPAYVAPTYHLPNNVKSADAGAFAILVEMIATDLQHLSEATFPSI